MAHRGPHPEDAEAFAEKHIESLQSAVSDYGWLLGRGYARNAALELVGNHRQLTARQRVAVARCACSEEAARRRRFCLADWDRVESVDIDGLNMLTTVEAALAGGVVLAAHDGCFRDLASFHGNYRIVEEARPAALLVGEVLRGRPARWYLDRPVSNTGRLATLLREIAEERSWPWSVELVPDPDRVLRVSQEVVATSDSGILDHGIAWTDLARRVVTQCVPEAWVLPLG